MASMTPFNNEPHNWLLAILPFRISLRSLVSLPFRNFIAISFPFIHFIFISFIRIQSVSHSTQHTHCRPILCVSPVSSTISITHSYDTKLLYVCAFVRVRCAYAHKVTWKTIFLIKVNILNRR